MYKNTEKNTKKFTEKNTEKFFCIFSVFFSVSFSVFLYMDVAKVGFFILNGSSYFQFSIYCSSDFSKNPKMNNLIVLWFLIGPFLICTLNYHLLMYQINVHDELNVHGRI